MATSKRRKPSFDAPTDPQAPANTEWVYRSKAVAPAGGAESPVADARPPVDAPRPTEAPTPAASPLRAHSVDGTDGRRRHDAARDIVDRHALYAAAAGVLPIPALDVAAIAAVQLAMLRSLAGHYAVPFTRHRGQAIVTALAGGLLPTAAGRGVLKFLIKHIPIAGTVFSLTTVSALASAVTYAVGQVVIRHLESGGTLEGIDIGAARRDVEQHVAPDART